MGIPYSETADARWGGVRGPTEAPIVEILFAHVSSPDQLIERYALLDTGADVCCIPQELAERLGWNPIRTEEVVGVHGPPRQTYVYPINLKVFSIEFNNLTVYGIDPPYPIIGRDVINRFLLLLDGPDKNLSILRENLVTRLLVRFATV